ncbi:hypothetical protein [Planococcus sp. CAU13]|uniref:hypothetical protein n=1 Tax=Planococcus sp. CAU13 TaxID=1541197 RepID=UPI0005300A5C|nr:hypothetical protein [Planococcus sp. CAU13]
MYFASILFSFILSMAAAVFVYRKKKTKGISILSALLINVLVLGTAFTVSYRINLDSWNFGTGDWEIAYLIIAIPLLTWLNAFLLQFVKMEELVR